MTEETRRIPAPGMLYRHFKNKLYQIVALARDSESGEEMVVYQALYGEYRVWVRPLSMFMGEVDREKYPDAAQRYRFEEMERPESQAALEEEEAKEEEPEIPGPRQLLLDFFDAMDEKKYDTMLEMLAKMTPKATQKELDDICTVLDLHPGSGEITDQLSAVRRHILMLKKFDGDRLR